MITIITGLPGAGKTLNTIAEIDQEHAGKRPIYYVEKGAVDEAGAGIAGLTLPNWTAFDNAAAWWDLPEGSIIVVDECQYVYPATGKEKGQPDWVVRFTEHRKKGFDIYLITQDARLVNHWLRRLAGRHVHYHRPFGAPAASRWEWARVVDPSDFHAKKEAVSTRAVKHPKQYYSAYASANVHTVKRTIPAKLYLLPLALVVIGFGGCTAWSVLHGRADKVQAEADQAKRGPALDAPGPLPLSAPAPLPSPPPPPAPPRHVAVNVDGRLSGFVSMPGASWVVLRLNSGANVRLALDACSVGPDGRSVSFCEWGGNRYIPAPAPVSRSLKAAAAPATE